MEIYDSACNYSENHFPQIEDISLTLRPTDLLENAIQQTLCNDLSFCDSNSQDGADSLSDIDFPEAYTWVAPSTPVHNDIPNNTDCPVSADNVQCSWSADNVQCPVSADNVQCPVSAENVQCSVRADNVQCSVSANNVQCPMSAVNVQCPVSAISETIKQDCEPVRPPCAMVANNVQSTPVSKRPPNLYINNSDSPGFDSRFNDSLSGLLGSPPPDSPLAKNPFFGDLQAILVSDCQEDMLPQSLLMSMATGPQADVFTREQDLHTRFTKLEQRFPQDIKQLSSFYRYQAAMIETERFRSLYSQSIMPDYKQSLNLHYDQQLHQIMDRVEQSVTLLEESEKNSKLRVVKPRPLLSKRAVKLMEAWYDQHLEHPYPNANVIEELSEAGNINAEQVKKWFANKRNRSNNTRTLTEIAKRKRQLSLKH